MKIALLSFEYPPETGFGGIGTYTWYHARALAQLGHEVHVLAGATERTRLRTSKHDGVHVHRFRAGGWMMRAFKPLGTRRLWWTQNRLENAWSMYRGLRALRRQHRFDIIEMPECGAEGLLVNNLMQERTVVRLHSPARLIMPYYDVRPADVRWCSRAEQLGIRGASAVTSCSQFLADEARATLGVRDAIPVIPNGIDITCFDATDPVDFREAHGFPSDRLMILFAGRMERRKGVHLLRDIVVPIVERHDITFVLAGQDVSDHVSRSLLPEIRAQRLRGSVHYLGKLDQHAVRGAVRQADIVLLPSLWESCPYACLEAMAAGRAIVASHQGGIPELLHDGDTGLLAVSGDPPSYVERLERLIEDRELRNRLGRAARQAVERAFTAAHTAQQSVNHYQAVA